MEIVSWNVDGLRSAFNKGFLDWFEDRKPDILCMQEVKADVGDVPPQLKQIPDLKRLGGYTPYWNPSQRKGHSGVGVLTKEEPIETRHSLSDGGFGRDGRVFIAEFPDFSLLNLYLPHGKRDKSDLPKKLEMYETLFGYLENLDKDVILCGDFNIAHKEMDLERPERNRNNTMFTSRERKQLDILIERGFVDTFRHFHRGKSKYTWWPYSNNAREKNIGWRIDYVFISSELTNGLKDAFILDQVKGSDHCPIGIEIKIG